MAAKIKIARSGRQAAPRVAATGNATAPAERSSQRNLEANDAGQSWRGGSSRKDAKAGALARSASAQA